MEYIFPIPPKKGIDDSSRTVYPPYVSGCSALARLRMRFGRTDRTSPHLCSCWFPGRAQLRTTRKIEPLLQEAAEVCALPKYCPEARQYLHQFRICPVGPNGWNPQTCFLHRTAWVSIQRSEFPEKAAAGLFALGSHLRSKRILGIFTQKGAPSPPAPEK